MNTRHYAFLLASRHRSPLAKGVMPDISVGSEDSEVQQLRQLLLHLQKTFGDRLVVLTIGGDCNFGLRVRMLCNFLGIGFAEYMLFFNVHLPKPFYEEFFFGRHGAIMDLVDGASPSTSAAFYFFLGRSRYTHLEDMITRVRDNGRVPYYIYAEDNTIVETNQTNSGELVAGKDMRGEPGSVCSSVGGG